MREAQALLPATRKYLKGKVAKKEGREVNERLILNSANLIRYLEKFITYYEPIKISIYNRRKS